MCFVAGCWRMQHRIQRFGMSRAQLASYCHNLSSYFVLHHKVEVGYYNPRTG